MLRETSKTHVLASVSNDRDLPTGSSFITIKMPSLPALMAEQSGTRHDTASATQMVSSRNRLLASGSVIADGHSLSFTQWAQITCGIRQRMSGVRVSERSL